MKKFILNFTPTGVIPSKKQNPNAPIGVNEIIEQVHEACELGITIAHLHARDSEGKNTGKKEVFSKIIEGIRRLCPELVVCVSLSGRTEPDFEKRSEVLELLPDMASLTLSSMNFLNQASINTPELIQRLAQKMNQYGVKPELECFDSGMINYAHYLSKKNIISAPYYFNLLFGNIFNAQTELTQVGLMLKELPENSYCSLGGLGVEQLKINATALANGHGVRVGLEDNLWFDVNRKIPATNITLVKRIHELAAALERPLLTSKEFGELGFYNAKYRKNQSQLI